MNFALNAIVVTFNILKFFTFVCMIILQFFVNIFVKHQFGEPIQLKER